MKEYIIVGDTEDYKDCLIYRCGTNKAQAENLLHRVLTNPNDNDKFVMKGHTNIHLEEIEGYKTWWNDMVD